MTWKHRTSYLRYCLPAAALLVFGCGNGNPQPPAPDPIPQFETLSKAICDPANGPFTTEIDNQFFPLPVGRMWRLEGEEAGIFTELAIEVTAETQEAGGVTTRIVEETHHEDGELVEFSLNFFVQAPDGTVCYYGESVDNYENGQIANHNGTWQAGEGSSLPGIIMPGNPKQETQFAQESAPGIAEDMSAIVGLGESLSVPQGDFSNTVHVTDWNPLDGQTMADGEDKFYAPGIGLIQDTTLQLVEFNP